MAEKDFDKLFQKYVDDSMSPEEFLQWKALVQQDPQRLESLLEEFVNKDQSEYGMDAPVEQLYARIVKPRPVRRLYALVAAAMVLLMAGAVVFYPSTKKISPTTIGTLKKQADAAPGKTGAVLTLANGNTIVLDSLQNGLVANTNAVLENGALKYGSTSGSTAFNTVSTARGRQFQVELPDGTKAWLNAASSLTYPTSFTGNERRVQLTGEVYFEVAKNAGKPFKVQAPDHTIIEVTGTHFNVNAYADESAITTTLTEGRVVVNQVAIKPGQQAILTTKDSRLNVQTADTVQALAWKNGIFDLNNADLPAVMRQLARWYDVNIVYEQPAPAIRFGGKMQRNLKLSQVLNGLSGMGVQFRIEEGQRVVVY